MNKNKPEFVVIETVQGQMTADVIKSHLICSHKQFCDMF